LSCDLLDDPSSVELARRYSENLLEIQIHVHEHLTAWVALNRRGHEVVVALIAVLLHELPQARLLNSRPRVSF
jgi:L-serine deaminase